MSASAGLPLTTERLFIRPMQTDDAAFIVDLLNDPSFLANIGDKGVRTLEDALGYIQTAGWDNYERFGYGMYTVELSDSGVRIGICGLLKRESLDDPDVGFALLEAHHGNGYATESAQGMLRHAREGLGLTKVCAITSLGNEPSANVLAKIGVLPAGTVRLTDDGPEIAYFEGSLVEQD